MPARHEMEEKVSEYIGRLLRDTYRINQLLGEGGTAVVFLGQDLLLDMPVAIKLLREDKLEPVDLKRFLREARTQAKLVHQNIVSIRSVVEEAGELFIVMEYIEGEDLETFIQYAETFPVFPLPTIKLIFTQILDGMIHAHKRNVIHRDIKPPNILLMSDGLIKLADFGLARELSSERLTSTGNLVGTPAYMSPEQLKCQELDHRTDIYSLGITLFELLVGYPPFLPPGERKISLFELMHRHITLSPPSLSQVGIHAPALDAVIRAALAKNPESRFVDCEQFKAAFVNAIDDLIYR